MAPSLELKWPGPHATQVSMEPALAAALERPATHLVQPVAPAAAQAPPLQL